MILKASDQLHVVLGGIEGVLPYKKDGVLNVSFRG